MNTRGFWRYALLAVGLLGLLSLFESPSPTIGTTAENFDLPLTRADDAARRTFSLSDRGGGPLLIEVFASWCGACRHSAPTVARAHARHGEQLGFLGVSVDSDFAAAERMKRDWKIPYPVAHDGDGSFARAYRVDVLPTFILVDDSGRIRHVSTGVPSSGQLDEWAALSAR